MLFQPTTIVFLQRGGLLVAGRRVKSTKYAFADELIHNLEVQNRVKLIEACQQFFAASGLGGKRVLLILDYSIVFEQTIKLDKSGQPDKLLEGFVAAMPFAEGQRACLGVESGSELRLFATNAGLYETVSEALRAAGVSSISAVLPIAAYTLSDQERTVNAATERILKDTTVVKRANFQDVTPV